MIQIDLKTGQRWTHFKGNEYVVLTTALHHHTLKPWVVYSNIAENPADVHVYVRPLKKFLEVMPNGVQRFTPKPIENHNLCEAYTSNGVLSND